MLTLLVHILLKDKDGSVIVFMALIIIDPTSSWLKVVELSLV